MASWSRTAPSLPSGSSWSSEKTTTNTQNYFKLTTWSSIARLDGNNYALKVRLDMSSGDYGSLSRPYSWALWVNRNGTEYIGYTTPGTGDFTIYLTDTAAPGTSIAFNAAVIDSAGSDPLSATLERAYHTAPALLGPTVYIKVSGAWKQGTPYIKVNGAWKQGQLKFKAGGAWK